MDMPSHGEPLCQRPRVGGSGSLERTTRGGSRPRALLVQAGTCRTVGRGRSLRGTDHGQRVVRHFSAPGLPCLYSTPLGSSGKKKSQAGTPWTSDWVGLDFRGHPWPALAITARQVPTELWCGHRIGQALASGGGDTAASCGPWPPVPPGWASRTAHARGAEQRRGPAGSCVASPWVLGCSGLAATFGDKKSHERAFKGRTHTGEVLCLASEVPMPRLCPGGPAAPEDTPHLRKKQDPSRRERGLGADGGAPSLFMSP